MATLPESNEYPAGIYQIETTDPVLGGPPNEATKAGLTNIPAQQLAKRTNWLKARVDQLISTVIAATTSVAGIVRLSSATNSTNETMAATPAAVKSVNDNAETRALKSTTITGGGMVKGGGSLGQHRILTVEEATLTETAQGEISDKVISPRRASYLLGLFGIPNAREVSDLNDNRGGMIAGATPANRPWDQPVVLNARRANSRSAQIAFTTVGPTPRMSVRSSLSVDDYTPWQEAWIGDRADFSHQQNGYQVLPSGLILQWGSVFINDTGISQAIFPLAFPTTFLGISLADSTVGDHQNVHIVSAANPTRFGFAALATRFNGSPASTALYFMAIGR